jgi:3D (Asp-Asp-Asp) domain-containing protein
LTFGYRKNKPIIFGKTIAKIIASEKAQIESIVAADPMIIKVKKRVLYIKSALLPFPNKNFQDCIP